MKYGLENLVGIWDQIPVYLVFEASHPNGFRNGSYSPRFLNRDPRHWSMSFLAANNGRFWVNIFQTHVLKISLSDPLGKHGISVIPEFGDPLNQTKIISYHMLLLQS